MGLSLEALENLGKSDEQLRTIEARVEELATKLKEGPPQAELADIKTELATMESQAKQLEGKGVDDVYTGELNSGKTDAKAQKKDMLRRLEALFQNFEAIFEEIKNA